MAFVFNGINSFLNTTKYNRSANGKRKRMSINRLALFSLSLCLSTHTGRHIRHSLTWYKFGCGCYQVRILSIHGWVCFTSTMLNIMCINTADLRRFVILVFVCVRCLSIYVVCKRMQICLSLCIPDPPRHFSAMT